MVRKGSYAKGVAKRQEILDKALEVVARVGYGGATVRQLADAVGLTQNGLLYYFGTKEKLFVEILRRRDQLDRDASPTDRTTQDFIGNVGAFIRRNMSVAGLVQLYTGLAAEATSPDHPAREYFQERFELLRTTYAGVVRKMQTSGTVPKEIDADKVAVLWVAVTDGLQTQWLYDPSIDMPEHLAYFWSLLHEAPSSTNGAAE